VELAKVQLQRQALDMKDPLQNVQEAEVVETDTDTTEIENEVRKMGIYGD
jgi:hypothetical protein